MELASAIAASHNDRTTSTCRKNDEAPARGGTNPSAVTRWRQAAEPHPVPRSPQL